MFGGPFKQCIVPATNQCSERKRQVIGIFAKIIREFYVGNRQGLLSWVKMHWGSSLNPELNVLRNQETSNLLFPGIGEMAILPWLYKPAMCSFSLLVQRRHCHSQSDVSWKEDMFGLPIKQCKLRAPNESSERKRQDIVLFAIIVGQFYVGNMQRLISWAKMLWGLCIFTDLNTHCRNLPSNLLFGNVRKGLLPWL